MLEEQRGQVERTFVQYRTNLGCIDSWPEVSSRRPGHDMWLVLTTSRYLAVYYTRPDRPQGHRVSFAMIGRMGKVQE